MTDAMTPASARELLERFKPQLCYDSQEAFFADSAEEMTANPGNTLRRAPHDGVDGPVIAAAKITGMRELSLQLLGEPAYGGGDAVRSDDRLAIAGQNYRAQYVRLRQARPDLRNRIYGRVKRDREDRLWLQYWFWYFYNDYRLAADFGLHEGDWEMIQLRMDGDGPDRAVYAQHREAETRAWSDVTHPPDHRDTPLVFPARGSHASYFEPGLYETEAWFDVADGKRAPRDPNLTLDVIENDSSPAWIMWPGMWGDTEPSVQGIEQPSPRGPACHEQWSDPQRLLDTAVTRAPLPLTAAAEAPQVKLSRSHGTMVLSYDFTGREGPEPVALVVTVNSREEPDMPPRTFTFSVERTRRGRLDTRVALDRGRHYDIRASVSCASGPKAVPSASVELHPVGEIPVDEVVDAIKHAAWSATQVLERLRRSPKPPGP